MNIRVSISVLHKPGRTSQDAWGRALLLFVFTLLIGVPGYTQKTIKLRHADEIVGHTEKGVRYDWVIGHVIFTQNQTTIYCDSAKRNKKENSIEAFGRIRITEGDSITVTAKELTYSGDDRIAHLRKNVIFHKLKTATLYTDYLDFDRILNEATYFRGGKLVDSTNTLTSRKGYFDLSTNMASFKKDVVGTSKAYTMTSDTLQYHTGSKIIFFRDKTVVTDAEGKVATYNRGYYDTKTRLSNLNNGSIETQSYNLLGDTYVLDDNRFFYQAIGNVVMKSKEENMIIYGDHGDFYKDKGVIKIYGNCYVAKVDEAQDTLFLSADSLVSIESKDPKLKRLLAYNNVKIFKSDMQGVADSVAYVSIDSVLNFYKSPVLWNGENQMTADSIKILMLKKTVDRINMVNNSFVASQDSLQNFNQIKGRVMTAFFRNKKIHHVDVNGNGQSLYYALEEKELKDSTAILRITFLTGLNKIDCSDMKINFSNGKINNITFMTNPEGLFVPPHELKPDQRVLEGFKWRGEEKPTRQDVLKPKAKLAVTPESSPPKENNK